MAYLMRAGGFPMWIVATLGLATLITAVMFMRTPKESLIGFFRGLSKATIFSIIGGVSADLSMTFYAVTHRFAEEPDRALYAMMGVSESLSPAILGFTLLAIAWVVAAIGIRRLGAAGI